MVSFFLQENDDLVYLKADALLESEIYMMCFCLAVCGLLLPAEIPWWSPAGSGSLRRDVPDPGTPGAWLARCSKVMHFNKAPPILFLKGIDYVLLKWALNSADPSPVGHFRGFFCLGHT